MTLNPNIYNSFDVLTVSDFIKRYKYKYNHNYSEDDIMNQYNNYDFINIKQKKYILREFMKTNNYYYMYIKSKDKIINIEKVKTKL